MHSHHQALPPGPRPGPSYMCLPGVSASAARVFFADIITSQDDNKVLMLSRQRRAAIITLVRYLDFNRVNKYDSGEQLEGWCHRCRPSESSVIEYARELEGGGVVLFHWLYVIAKAWSACWSYFDTDKMKFSLWRIKKDKNTKGSKMLIWKNWKGKDSLDVLWLFQACSV